MAMTGPPEMRREGLSEEINHITGDVVDASLKIHRTFGAGVYESVYKAALAAELRKRGRNVLREFPVRVTYEGEDLGIGFRIDLLVDGCVVVEVKAVDAVLSVHRAQVLTYLRLGAFPVGLLVNFRSKYLHDGIFRLLP